MVVFNPYSITSVSFFTHSAQDVCPPAEYQPENCRTCCCKSSDNVDFYHPEAAYQPECGATDNAEYKISLIPTISPLCHYDYPFTDGIDAAYFSDLLVTSHGPFQGFDACLDVIFENIFNYLVRTEEVSMSIREFLASETSDGIIRDFILSTDVLEPGNMKRRSGFIDVSPTYPFLTLISKLASIQYWITTSNDFLHLLDIIVAIRAR